MNDLSMYLGAAGYFGTFLKLYRGWGILIKNQRFQKFLAKNGYEKQYHQEFFMKRATESFEVISVAYKKWIKKFEKC